MFSMLTQGFVIRTLLSATLLATTFAFTALVVAAQEPTPTPTPMPTSAPSPASTPIPTPTSEPLYSEYRGVSIGMSVEEARTKLGAPKSKGTRQDFFVISEKESVQVYYRDAKVSAISINYTGDGAPTPIEVLGVEVQPKKNGSMHKLIRYPQAGYWVSYSRTAGKTPITTVTMRRLQTRRR